jgi:gliding motility-associated-like protein
MQKTIWLLITAVLFAGVSVSTVAGQDETQPLSPVLEMVTVDPVTGFAVIRWLPSPSTDVGSYVVYTYSGGTATAVDTVRSPYITTYTHTASVARYRSVAYVVAAVDSSLNISPLSNSLSTVWLSAEEDICTGTITVTWTPYVNQNYPATGYVVNIFTGTGSSPTEVMMTPDKMSYTLTGYEPDTEYCFYVTAIADDDQLASSCSDCLTTGSEVPPAWLEIEAITVGRTGLRFYAAYDPATSMDNFRLYRYNSAITAWEEAASSAGVAGELSFDLFPADTTTANLYRTGAINSCGLAATFSEPARNIVLAVSLTGTRIDLRWNRPSKTGSELFTVWRDIGDGPVDIASSLADTLWSEDYEGFASYVTAPAVVYRVTAEVQPSPEGMPAHLSSAAIIEAIEKIYMPNAFTPAIPGENALFRPEFTFMPVNYEFRIWSRNGVLLFRTDNPSEGWDGKHNSTPMPPGVYLWSLNLTTPAGRIENRNGTVTILP